MLGAGVGGLVAARELARAGLHVLVLDGRDAPGGAVRAHTVAGTPARRGGRVLRDARRVGRRARRRARARRPRADARAARLVGPPDH
ncbi:NAD(P)-binding protein, partial [Cellulomonas massiliensis]|uniref:NAD(P)-binding protein n=1 Tax=Cellulomonas massiliensis TaxID=1465811 RepID=UPI0027952B07